MIGFGELLKAWLCTLGFAVLHTAFLGGNVGRLRGVHKSWATEEDRVKNGGEGTVGDCEEVKRGNNAHRNQLENLPLFIAASTMFVVHCIFVSPLTNNNHDYQAGIALFVIWVAARVGHSIAYYHSAQPWRTICFLTGTLAVVILVLYAVINTLNKLPETQSNNSGGN